MKPNQQKQSKWKKKKRPKHVSKKRKGEAKCVQKKQLRDNSLIAKTTTRKERSKREVEPENKLKAPKQGGWPRWGREMGGVGGSRRVVKGAAERVVHREVQKWLPVGAAKQQIPRRPCQKKNGRPKQIPAGTIGRGEQKHRRGRKGEVRGREIRVHWYAARGKSPRGDRHDRPHVKSGEVPSHRFGVKKPRPR